ncbi:MAG: sodium:solute symporter family protein [Phycisphaerae bacterium]|nr:sodium:solute symporter family protein [Phycisphaerae bacterium]NIP51224.1 sodium:solute symporter family protein [Phycisphaerae bacterium]NIS50430.1 sodium:solute symporter family protein [Phycisphaerae bacterium]NIU08165.1 sodium:solute symporter family protein [Phycisphaerae bacterium]NIU54936.1 sodium:solute symporter family protein [Phycisphaerae bacterium]
MWDSAIIILYLSVILLLGLRCGRGMKSLQEFSVSHRSYTSIVIFATLSASFIGGGFSIGNAEKVFRFGIVNIVALWGFSLKEILVARYIAPKTGNFTNVISTGDIMEQGYGKAAKVITGFFSVFFCAGIVGAQVRAMGIIFNVFLDIEPIWGILIGCGIVIAYSTVGGMRAVVLTDVIQFCVLAIGLPAALVFGIVKLGGFAAIREAVPTGHFSIPGEAMTIAAFLSLFLTFLLGETLVPPYVQRLFMGKDSSHTARGTMLSGIFSIPFFAITGAIGLVALTLKPELNPNLAMPYVVRTVLPIGVRGIVIAGVISIVMSSADSFLNGAATGCINDMVKPLRKNPLSERQELLLAKLTNCFVGVIAVIFAITIDSVLDILIYSYNFWAPVILVPLAAVLLGFRATKAGFLAGTVAGISGVLIWNKLLKSPMGVDGLVIGVLCNLIAFTVTNKLSINDTK